MEFVNPFPTALWRNRKSSRTEWRATHVTKSKIRYGGRGRAHGLKGRKNPNQR